MFYGVSLKRHGRGLPQSFSHWEKPFRRRDRTDCLRAARIAGTKDELGAVSRTGGRPGRRGVVRGRLARRGMVVIAGTRPIRIARAVSLLFTNALARPDGREQRLNRHALQPHTKGQHQDEGLAPKRSGMGRLHRHRMGRLEYGFCTTGNDDQG